MQRETEKHLKVKEPSGEWSPVTTDHFPACGAGPD